MDAKLSDLRMNEEFTMETMVVRIQVENKLESRNRKALSWSTQKRRREVASRNRSAITSAASNYRKMNLNGDGSISLFLYTHRLV